MLIRLTPTDTIPIFKEVTTLEEPVANWWDYYLRGEIVRRPETPQSIVSAMEDWHGGPEAALALRLAEDLDLDSLDIVAAGIECEDEFGIEFEDAEVDGMKTLGDLVGMVERKTP